MRRFAEDTSVPIAQSRSEIDRLLRQWGADGVQWTDEWVSGKVILRFIWPKDDEKYQARFILHVPTDAEIRASDEVKDLRSSWRGPSESKVQKALGARGKQEHRLLLLWLKAAFNAVEAGLVDAETLFLPFLEGRDGQTVAERALPRLPELLSANADRLLAEKN